MDFYLSVHKALRAAMADTLLRLGATDFAGPEGEPCLAQIGDLLELLATHVRLENEHLHCAIEARQQGASRALAEAHAELSVQLVELADELARVRSAASAAARAALCQRLYRHLARLVGRKLEHMAVEEITAGRALRSLYDPAELHQLQRRLLAATPATHLLQVQAWAARGLSPREQAELDRAWADARPATSSFNA
jgi:hypothetical protein